MSRCRVHLAVRMCAVLGVGIMFEQGMTTHIDVSCKPEAPHEAMGHIDIHAAYVQRSALDGGVPGPSPA